MRIFGGLFKRPGKENGRRPEKVVESIQMSLPDVYLDNNLVNGINEKDADNIREFCLQKIAEEALKLANTKFLIKRRAENELLKHLVVYVNALINNRNRPDMGTNQMVKIDVPADFKPITLKVNLRGKSTNGTLTYPFQISLHKPKINENNILILDISYVGSGNGTQFTGDHTGVEEDEIHHYDSRPY